jgi:alginate O-acetyltransferase complex protein AlgI
MLFCSYSYLFLFLPCVVIVYFFLLSKKTTTAVTFLIVASVFFYAFFSILHLFCFLLMMMVNFSWGKIISRKKTNKFLLWAGILFNLLVLVGFKYTNFLIENINFVFNENFSFFNIIFPIGISFFVFQQIAYLVDCSRKKIQFNVQDYCLFSLFFPKILAGPMTYYDNFIPQIHAFKNAEVNYDNIMKGIIIFSIGMFKKQILADSLDSTVLNGFSSVDSLTFVEGWITSLAYTLQIYFDFSGYTDMAIGSSLFFNINLPANFCSPYKALNIQDFWKRWHITLSRFLRDFIYIPLGGNRKGRVHMYMAIVVTFLIGGLWHGASWSYVLWGMCHGIGLVIFHIFKKVPISLNSKISWFINFNFINVTWIFFRAQNIEDAFKVIKAMFNVNNIVLHRGLYKFLFFLKDYNVSFGPWIQNLPVGSVVIVWIFLLFFMITSLKNTESIRANLRCSYKWVFFTVFVFCYVVLNFSKSMDFIYQGY